MSASISLDEKFEAGMKNSQSLSPQTELLMRKLNEGAPCDQELQAKNEYLRKQLGAVLKQKLKVNEEPLQSKPRTHEQVYSHNVDSSSKDEPLRMARPEPRFQASTNDFKVEIKNLKAGLTPENSWIGSYC